MAFEPFIVTAEMPADILWWADGLRRAHFPPERNHLQAHVTLFHALAPSLREEVLGYLPRIVGLHEAPAARITGLMDLGGGTALRIESPAMSALREEIADHFHGTLTAQDSQPKRLHITIQNKVDRAAAKALQAELSVTPIEREFNFTGIGLHLYKGGPWEALGRWPFRR
ncbi:2'-5' RNA ligase family protein [Novosphingobium sp. MW5]|nr:2'-5' RNA ligase family protein [Novosphingobium sp. MW5]